MSLIDCKVHLFLLIQAWAYTLSWTCNDLAEHGSWKTLQGIQLIGRQESRYTAVVCRKINTSLYRLLLFISSALIPATADMPQTVADQLHEAQRLSYEVLINEIISIFNHNCSK